MSDDVSFSVHGLNADNSVRLGDDTRTIAIFYRHSVRNEVKSKEAGTPIFEARDHVKIFHPGEKDCLDRPVKELDKRRFPQQWMAYQSGREQIADGTPLDILFPGSPEVVATMRALHINTVQQLAACTDQAIGNLPFGFDQRKKAQDFMTKAESGKTFHALEKQLQERDELIKKLERRIDALEGEETEEKPRRGRPRKQENTNVAG